MITVIDNLFDVGVDDLVGGDSFRKSGRCSQIHLADLSLSSEVPEKFHIFI